MSRMNDKDKSTFADKPVLKLSCAYCDNFLCDRAMRAILLADKSLHLYSTDLPFRKCVDTVYEAYRTEKCSCLICDVACLKCGNIVGYNVAQPCRTCILACHNNHYWMFHSVAISEEYQVNNRGEILLWGEILDQNQSKPSSMNQEECCR